MKTRFEVWHNDQGRYEVRDLAKDGYLIASTGDPEQARKLADELNGLAQSCDKLGIELLTRDNS